MMTLYLTSISTARNITKRLIPGWMRWRKTQSVTTSIWSYLLQKIFSGLALWSWRTRRSFLLTSRWSGSMILKSGVEHMVLQKMTWQSRAPIKVLWTERFSTVTLLSTIREAIWLMPESSLHGTDSVLNLRPTEICGYMKPQVWCRALSWVRWSQELHWWGRSSIWRFPSCSWTMMRTGIRMMYNWESGSMTSCIITAISFCRIIWRNWAEIWESTVKQRIPAWRFRPERSITAKQLCRSRP